MERYTIYTDGGARGNPGPAGVGGVIQDGDGNEVATISEHVGEQTNNWAEYEAVIRTLKKLRSVVGKNNTKNIEVEAKLDSELVTKQLRGEYQIKEEGLFAQYIAAHNMRVAYFPNISFTHVPREKNARADALANEAMDVAEQQNLL